MSITNPIPLLPLLTSTAFLQFATGETFFFSLFLRPSHSAQSATLLPSYLSAFSRPAILIIASILGIQLLASLAAIALSEQTFWYWAGFALTLAHFPFAPFAAPAAGGHRQDGKGEGEGRRGEGEDGAVFESARREDVDGEFGGMGVFWDCGGTTDDVMWFLLTGCSWCWTGWGGRMCESNVCVSKHRKSRLLSQDLKQWDLSLGKYGTANRSDIILGGIFVVGV
jgi:hypothetical protein